MLINVRSRAACIGIDIWFSRKIKDVFATQMKQYAMPVAGVLAIVLSYFSTGKVYC